MEERPSVGFSKGSQPVLPRISEKTMENSEWLGRQARLDIERGASRLSVQTARPLDHWWGNTCIGIYNHQNVGKHPIFTHTYVHLVLLVVCPRTSRSCSRFLNQFHRKDFFNILFLRILSRTNQDFQESTSSGEGPMRKDCLMYLHETTLILILFFRFCMQVHCF